MSKIVEPPTVHTSTPTACLSSSGSSCSTSNDDSKQSTDASHVSKKTCEVPKTAADILEEGGRGLGLSSVSKKSNSRSDTSSVISIRSIIYDSVLSDIKPNVKNLFEIFLTNDIPSYTPINVESSDASNEQTESEPSISGYEDIIEDVDISDSFPYKVHKTTMDPEFLVVTNECNINMQPRGVYLSKNITKQKPKLVKIKQGKPQPTSLSQPSSSYNYPVIEKPIRLKCFLLAGNRYIRLKLACIPVIDRLQECLF
ncbi:hypothetical protein L1987_42489 [Smallanthus sonchifolius]|uniref:Uncharacterized protein n=1 Tax=Smallanthus sonchifolius TaxID=185202 RepID=A0ACB9GK36_9ASTR|nr:hypothetical protein L1987_42489 [Smallanthus sonchifolius]